jgi:hypothetical protein
MNHSPDLLRLCAEGFIIELREGHVLLHEIPYVDSSRAIRRGTLIAIYQPSPPAGTFDHRAWFIGAMPCGIDGVPLVGIGGADAKGLLGTSMPIDRMFSTKPIEGCYADHYAQLKRYVEIISTPATAMDPSAVPVLPKPQEVIANDDNDVFVYYDTGSVRSAIQAANLRFKGLQVAIVGVGGTGSYILDLVAKTRVAEIHLIDADVFSNHNAFRAPGAARKDELDTRPTKISYLAGHYDVFRKGIVRHETRITAENLDLLAGMNFVFIAVDDGPSRGLIATWLEAHAVPYVDVGMGLDQNEAHAIFGQCRVTCWTPGDPPAVLPTDPKSDHDLYRSSIQTAETNALSAALAVMRWKRYIGFYHNDGSEREIIVNVARNSVCLS